MNLRKNEKNDQTLFQVKSSPVKGKLLSLSKKVNELNNELKLSREEMDALHSITELVASTFELEVVLEHVFATFSRFTGCDRTLICFVSRTSKELICRYELGKVKLGEIGKVFTGESLLIQCLNENRMIIKINVPLKSREGMGDKIAIPLKIQKETVGVILIESSQPETLIKTNRCFLESIANNSAVAIKCAELFNSMLFHKRQTEALYEETAAINERLKENIRELSHTKEQLKSKNNELSDYYNHIQTAYLQTVIALSNSIEAKDPYTRGHCQRVMEISCEAAKQMGLSDREINQLRYCAILHDIGKIGIPSSILNKRGKLSTEEFCVVKKHPVLAYNILKDVEFIRDCMDGILQHHERFDGKGYPNGLKGKEINKLGRILCVADSLDAMTSDRPYRPAMTMREATAEIKKCSGTQFDPEITEIFIQMLK